MDEPRGLRERKRQRTHDALSEAAISLFLQHGYDQVSVADVAAAAEVSKPTLFKYFPSKEDLVLHRILDHRAEAARVVRDRSPGEAPLVALHRHFLAGLARRDPVTGLNDHPEVLAFHGMVFGTPSLAARVAQYATHDEGALAEALAEAAPAAGTLDARLAASQIIAVQRVLARENWRRLTEGQAAAEVHPVAVAAVDRAFQLLTGGLTGYAAPSDGSTDGR
ncbi:TetR family transcriptional regulator [Plantactinospora sp. S1510]|uniref:TetR family transcriptional regulator n=1 Tax=Plantactinospora alkalitolerans TaxID=2789879 RepID=A0ABS0H3D0_9ACTN|nr:TetR/AcrR family transcriptional regulator [Plantactinospora alkalitolerans]MBF9132975.1 TetR family transcriptional regulator [Plantactinospora alkalitolerans]